MRLNIWRALLCASDTEITEGMSFYHGAHGLCKFISQALTGGAISTRQVAGIYAALSPMNVWDSNVANILDIIRLGPLATVNTTHINRSKALWIRSGFKTPEQVLGGRKVAAFYRAIADPSDYDPIPVDRHLICLALGVKITSNLELSRASSQALYSRIEQVYSELGKREGIGNRLASIAWFVQRRVESGQQLMFHSHSPVCCSKPMQRFGRGRLFCSTCRALRYPASPKPATKLAAKPPIAYIDGYPVSLLNKRKIISLPRDHQLANKWGFQYLSRYLVMRETGQRLRSDEHVDHINQDKLDDRLANFRVMLAESHGRHHVYLAELAGGRGPDGRFTVYSQPIDLTSEVPF